jgi:hypothetical protein
VFHSNGCITSTSEPCRMLYVLPLNSLLSTLRKWNKITHFCNFLNDSLFGITTHCDRVFILNMVQCATLVISSSVYGTHPDGIFACVLSLIQHIDFFLVPKCTQMCCSTLNMGFTLDMFTSSTINISLVQHFSLTFWPSHYLLIVKRTCAVMTLNYLTTNCKSNPITLAEI